MFCKNICKNIHVSTLFKDDQTWDFVPPLIVFVPSLNVHPFTLDKYINFIIHKHIDIYVVIDS
jgi:hypothetical protein